MVRQHLVDRIEEQYNPEHDMPDGVQVTWTDAYLLQIIKAQQAQIEKLQKQVESIDIVLRRNLAP